MRDDVDSRRKSSDDHDDTRLDADGIRRVLRRLFAAELEIGDTPARDDYRRLFPGFEPIVDEEFEALNLSAAGDTSKDAADFASISATTPASIGPYRVVRELGRGGQATVFLAEDPELGRQIAIKVLTGFGGRSEGTLRRFRREAELCSKLDDPGICAVYGVGVDRGAPYIAMQLLEGQTLSERIAGARRASLQDEAFSLESGNSIPESTATDATSSSPSRAVPDRDETERLVKIVERIARALHVAHEAGIVHRDVKPGNIIVRDDDTPVVLDFGLAHDDLDDDHSLTRTGDFFGTPAYMSPEQMSAHRIELDRRTDVFSLGATLFECLTLIRPFDAPTRAAVYQAIMTKEPPVARKINPSISKDLWAVMQTALEKDRDRRYPDAATFADDLGRTLRLEPIQARPAGPILRTWRWVQRNPTVAALAAILMLVLVGGGTWFVRREADFARARRVEKLRESTLASAEENFRLLRSSSFSALISLATLSDLTTDLNNLGDDGTELVRQWLDSPDKRDRLTATQVCLMIDRPDLGDRLFALTEEDDDFVAAFASQALMRSNAPGIVSMLERLTDNERHAAVRVNGLWGLCRLGDAGGIAKTKAYLADDGESISLRLALGRSILLLRHPEILDVASDFVEDILEHPERFGPGVADIIELAAEFYRSIDTPEAVRSLERLAADPRVSDDRRDDVARILREATPKVDG